MDTVTSEKFGFNQAASTIMHIDLNSCFATIEQQANPHLRGKPVAVCAYTTGNGCILAASYEAKALGIGTGMQVRAGLALCPTLILLPSDPAKYRYVNRKLLFLFQSYTDTVEVKSIDEMVLSLKNTPVYSAHLKNGKTNSEAMLVIGAEIKRRIKEEIGEWLTVSVGFAPNRYLAKIAACRYKPDGLSELSKHNIREYFSTLQVEQLTGIKYGYGSRLRCFGINTALDFYNADIKTLKQAFHSVIGHHWWLRLHGWEADDREFATKSIGHSYALYKAYCPSDPKLHQILCQLVEKMGARLRRNKYKAEGIHISTLLLEHSFWHRGRKLPQPMAASIDLYHEALTLLREAPDVPVRTLSVSVHYLSSLQHEQEHLWEDNGRKNSLYKAIDTLSERYGSFTVVPARMLDMERKVLDRISFGSVKELQDFVFQEPVNGTSEFVQSA